MSINSIKSVWNTIFYFDIISIDYWNDYLYLNLKNSNKIIKLDTEGKSYKYLDNNKFEMFSLKDISDNVIINNYLFSVDSKLSMCRIFCLKTNKPIAIFGFKNINNPTVIDGFFCNNTYHIFTNDNNNIIKYEIVINDEKIVSLDNYGFISLEGNIKSILVDKKYKKFYIANEKDLIVYNTNGEYLKSIKSLEPYKLKMFKEYILYVDSVDDGNRINIINRYDQENVNTFFSKKKMNIVDFTIDNEDNLFLINDYYLISKMKINYSVFFDEVLIPLAIGSIFYYFSR